jgi:hypothetical protein
MPKSFKMSYPSSFSDQNLCTFLISHMHARCPTHIILPYIKTLENVNYFHNLFYHELVHSQIILTSTLLQISPIYNFYNSQFPTRPT